MKDFGSWLEQLQLEMGKDPSKGYSEWIDNKNNLNQKHEGAIGHF